jgi:hypothetical protein
MRAPRPWGFPRRVGGALQSRGLGRVGAGRARSPGVETRGARAGIGRSLGRMYRRVLGMLVLVGAVAGCVLMAALALLAPADPWPGTGLFVLFLLWGSLLGIVGALGASAGLALTLLVWTWRRSRGVASRAWLGALGAAVGAAVIWLLVGFVSWLVGVDGADALLFAVFMALLSAVIAGAAAGPITARAARRADARAAAAAAGDEA